MPEPENPKPRATRKKPTDQKPQEQLLCHIHNDADDWERDKVREDVCVSSTEYQLTEFESKHYCLFHLPTKEKDIAKFEELFQARLQKIAQQCAEIENKFPDDDDKQNKAKGEKNLSYDFSFVWFPSIVMLFDKRLTLDLNFESAKFQSDVNFSSVVFTSEVNFSSAVFTSKANFDSALFKSEVNFSSAIFQSDVFFDSAKFSSIVFFDSAEFKSSVYCKLITFESDATFSSATFTTFVDFTSATFTSDIDFSSATFTAGAFFSSAKFLATTSFERTKFGEKGRTEFYETVFEKDTFFDETNFESYVSFNSAIFGKESDVFFRKTFFAENANFRYCTSEGYLRFSNLRQGKDCKFDFQEAAFEKASRVSFNTVKLQPNWFVNIDSRKFVFTDIEWQNLKSERGNKNITAELDALKKRKIEAQGKRLLEIAARQLAVNAEENNRYEDAADFRYMAMETKRLELLNKLSFSRYLIWLYKWTSGYGENWSWAALVLIGLLFFFGLLYATPLAKFDYGERKREVAADNVVQMIFDVSASGERFRSLNIGEGIVHSLYVAALQRPEPKSADTLTKLLVILETIFAPLQAALLALAIRRKFMR